MKTIFLLLIKVIFKKNHWNNEAIVFLKRSRRMSFKHKFAAFSLDIWCNAEVCE